MGIEAKLDSLDWDEYERKRLVERRLMCACADNDSNWRRHGLSAYYVCSCGGETVSAKGLRWLNEF